MTTEIILQQINKLEEEENYKAAYEVCVNALESDGNNTDLLEKTAILAKMNDNPQKSIECWEKLISINPNIQLAYSELQDLYFGIDKFKYYSVRAKYRIFEHKPDAAADDFKKAISCTTDEKLIIETRFMIANIYMSQGKDEKAENQFLLILDLEANTNASMMLAQCYVKNDDVDAAISTLETAYENDTDNIELKKFMYSLYMRVGNTQKASEFVIDEFSNTKLLLQQGKNDEAKNALDNWSGKKETQYYLLLAEYYYNTKQYDDCFAAIDEFAKYSPKHPLIFQMRALCFEQQENIGRAKYNWGWYNLMKNQPDVALAEFLASNDIEKSADTLEQIIRLYDNQRETTTSIEFVAELVELEPRNTLALSRLGKFYLEIGDYYNSCQYYSRILEYDPNNLKVLPGAAKAAEKCGEEAIALEYYKRIVENSKDEEEKKVAQKRLNILNGEEEETLISKFLDLIKKF